ncbi:MAG TPA: hypothetical protein VG293_01400 [Solirubrobacteraceae bacterium]|nr:hypothetical protein [Solirubrobacteraceae bacterium]
MAFRQQDVALPVWRIHRHLGMGGDQLVGALAGKAFDQESGDAVRAAHDVLYLASIQSVSTLEGAREPDQLPGSARCTRTGGRLDHGR